ncbi:hypothetical protein X275_01185 [Marinitoga sp. 1197]|uniref:hypothetical protein n=1 Tax=unclassified Marinitoga TaxID=2640159 RepID=UPI0006417F26|nr:MULTISPECIES: hypothetical protein [unclassified Marinitoga]AJW76963.1 hypothetical protein UF08_74 [Marinitoga camini virus 1]AJW76968.1 hypothetical protein UF09_2 [Marinitoga camini virus 2]KLO24036.1 hypothetical protein X275_01185 [Marinitoga sp. 1197]KLO24796.1 hypothetical protein X274_02265 [Marinitoga sp. 1155]
MVIEKRVFISFLTDYYFQKANVEKKGNIVNECQNYLEELYLNTPVLKHFSLSDNISYLKQIGEEDYIISMIKKLCNG